MMNRNDDKMTPRPATQAPQTKPARSGRGFAGMDPQRQREIASKGGKSVPAGERSFSRNPGLAASAGRKGGKSVPAGERSFSRNHSLAVEAGRKGGRSRPAPTTEEVDQGNK